MSVLTDSTERGDAVSRPDVSLAERYAQVRQFSVDLCAPLEPEDYQVQPMDDASPPKWHLAHVTWFFETFLLKKHLAGYREFNPAFEVLFNSYYNGVGEQYPRPRRGHMSRPTLDEVMAYRRHVDNGMIRLMDTSLSREVRFAIELGLNHEQQHQELILTDLKYNLGNNPLKPPYVTSPAVHQAGRPSPGSRMIAYEGGLVETGRSPGNDFCFDNETPRHRVYLEPFSLSSHAVTCGEFMEFINDDGYNRPELWLSDGWAHLASLGSERWQAPLYWRQDEPGGEYLVYTLTGERRLNPDEPVCHVSFYEADAFARWRGMRLPAEAEWELAASDAAVCGNFVEDGRFHPAPLDDTSLDETSHGRSTVEESPNGPSGLFGDVWEWTASAYGPYPGFQTFEGQLGEYNGKFMSNQLVLRGGSCATSRSHIRSTYRNFFYPPDRWQFSGFRLAADS